MGRFLFSTAPLPGHLDWGGMLATAKLLQERGHEVLWASGAKVMPLLEKQAIPSKIVPFAFRPPPQPWTPLDDPAAWYAFQVEQTINIWCDQTDILQSVQAHVELIDSWQPDLIVTEPMVYAAALAAELRQIPLACCGFPGAYMVIEDFGASQPIIQRWNTLRNDLRNQLGLSSLAYDKQPELFFSSKDLHLVFFPPQWFKHVSKRPSRAVQYVGGQARAASTPAPEWLSDIPTHRPLVTITQSTGFGYGGQILPRLLEALQSLDVSVIITGQVQHRTEHEPLPDSVHWVDWVDYDHVLPRTQLLIHHGGMGTTHTAVCHGVPQIVTPVAADQYIHAERIMAYGAGVMLQPHELNVPNIHNVIHSLLTNNNYVNHTQTLQTHFARFGGVKRAADLLTQMLSRQKIDQHMFINQQ